MKIIPRITVSSDMLLATVAVAMLIGLSGGCTSYNPRSGTYEHDPGKTMVAVGAAALAGSVIYHEHNRDRYYRPPKHHHKKYRRPPHHYHYHRSPPRRYPYRR